MEPVITVSARLDYAKVPVKRGVKLSCLLKVDADRPEESSRRPLNIGVVLDRSGSMNGVKIHNVREATKALAGQLGAADLFSLTLFDHVIETLIRPRRMGEGLGSLNRVVDGIEARGSTDLCGGYRAGCENVLGKRGDGALDRVVLLTDGLANVGTTDPMAIASLSGEMAERGIVTSTIGVGADYSEALLGRMAEAGGGNTYFLQSANEIQDVLGEELGGLLSLAAEGLRVRFEPGEEGVHAVQLNAYRVSSDGAWVLGDVYGSQSKVLVLELEIPPLPVVGKVRCGTLHLAGNATSEGGKKEFKESMVLDVDVVPEQDFAAQAIDMDVTLHAVELISATARIGAWEIAARHDFDGAAKALNDAADRLERIGVRHPEIDKHVGQLRAEARRLGDEMEAYYTPMMKKSMYYEAYYARNAKPSHLGSMRRRHSGGAPDECHRFPLHDVNGHPVAEIGSGRYGIDLGRPDSVGDGWPITVGSRSFDLGNGPEIVAATSQDIGAHVSGILGADLLARFEVGIGGGYLILDEGSRALPGRVVKADFGSGIPVVPARIGGVEVSLALRTGSRMSFLRADLAAGGEPAGRESVTIAGVGSFETDLRKVELRVGDGAFVLRVATLPPALDAAFQANGRAGFLGADFLSLRTLWVSLRQGIVILGSVR